MSLCWFLGVEWIIWLIFVHIALISLVFILHWRMVSKLWLVNLILRILWISWVCYFIIKINYEPFNNRFKDLFSEIKWDCLSFLIVLVIFRPKILLLNINWFIYWLIIINWFWLIYRLCVQINRLWLNVNRVSCWYFCLIHYFLSRIWIISKRSPLLIFIFFVIF